MLAESACRAVVLFVVCAAIRRGTNTPIASETSSIASSIKKVRIFISHSGDLRDHILDGNRELSRQVQPAHIGRMNAIAADIRVRVSRAGCGCDFPRALNPRARGIVVDGNEK